MGNTSYAIALGSNRRHGRHGAPGAVLRAAVAEIRTLGNIVQISRIRSTPPLGPAGRSFANAALLLESALEPPVLLGALKAVEQRLGRRRGRRWGPRVLDLDIILWSGGMWTGDGLAIPHPSFRIRGFVLDPLTEIAPLWRDPATGYTVRQLRARLTRPRPAPRCVAKGR